MPTFIEQTLQAAFPGRIYVSPGEALALVPGPQPKHPDSAAYQRITRGTYPFPTRLVAGRRVVALADLAGSISGDAPPSPSPRRRGRPRKVAVSASAAQGVDHV